MHASATMQDLPDELFEALSARIAEVSGIRIPTTKRWWLASRVGDRMRASGATDAHAFVEKLLARGGEHELGLLVEAVRVGETSFFRHRAQLRAIRRVALPEIAARREREGDLVVRVWSAGCATGEEPYTIAMLLADALPPAAGWRHEILATDLSEAALSQAREARYPATSVHGVPPHVAKWAFTTMGDSIVIAPAVRATVRFERRNLLEAAYPRGFDLVLCRNVLIYFERSTQRDVVDRLATSLVPGGWLALGYAERLEGAALSPVRTEDGVLYRRDDPKVPWPEKPAAIVAPATPVPSRVSRSVPPPRRPSSRPPRPPSAPPRALGSEVPALSGELEGEPGERAAQRAVAAALAAASSPTIDLREVRFADEAVARVLARGAEALAADGRELVLITDAPGMLRFLRRHGVVPPARAQKEPGGRT